MSLIFCRICLSFDDNLITWAPLWIMTTVGRMLVQTFHRNDRFFLLPIFQHIDGLIFSAHIGTHLSLSFEKSCLLGFCFDVSVLYASSIESRFCSTFVTNFPFSNIIRLPTYMNKFIYVHEARAYRPIMFKNNYKGNVGWDDLTIYAKNARIRFVHIYLWWRIAEASILDTLMRVRWCSWWTSPRNCACFRVCFFYSFCCPSLANEHAQATSTNRKGIALQWTT